MSSLMELAYVSCAKEDLTENDLQEILTVARARNHVNDITGLLVYFDQYFVQIIEGEQMRIENLFSKICEDDRHDNVLSLLCRPRNTRRFPDWGMGFVHASSLDLSGLRHSMTCLPDDHCLDLNQHREALKAVAHEVDRILVSAEHDASVIVEVQGDVAPKPIATTTDESGRLALG